MTEATVLCQVADRVATLTLNRPEALNALTPEMLAELVRHLETLAASDAVSVVILTGAGRAFSAGVDLKALKARGVDLAEGNVGDDLNAAAQRATELLANMPQATIAKVNGFCFTGGLEIMLACDIAIIAIEAKLGDTHARLGLRPTWGMTQRLPRRVGRMRAAELAFTARTFDGREAADIGLALEAVPRADLDGRVHQLATRIAANSPGSIAAYKSLFATADNTGLGQGLADEAAAEFDIADAPDRMAAFLATLGGRG